MDGWIEKWMNGSLNDKHTLLAVMLPSLISHNSCSRASRHCIACDFSAAALSNASSSSFERAPR